jgi:hypothetical protein
LTAKKFGRLVVERFAGFDGVGTLHSSRRIWKCRCTCGGTTFQPTNALKQGNTRSCGCLNLEHRIAIGHANRTHGATIHVNGKQVLAPEYVSWRSMKMRCLNPKNPSYPHYGGQGIMICKCWRGKHGFINFLADLGPRPKGTTLHRKNNRLGYCPSNVVWADRYTQNHERSISTSQIIRKAWKTRKEKLNAA